MADREVSVDGVKVVYTDRGEGAPLLLMHGNPDTRHSWEPMLGKLGKGLRILAPDFPGFGDSQPFPAEVDFGPDLMADFWDKFLDAATVSEPVHVVVHDFGGPWLLPWVALQAQRVKSVFILNTLFQRDYPWHSWARIWQRPVMGEMSMLIFNRYMMRREMRAYAPGVPPELVDEGYSRMHRTMRRTLLRTYRAYSRPAEVFDPWEQRLSEALADIPVYVLWGDQDPYIGKEFAERYGVGADHRPDLGHWLHLQEPGLVAETLGTFLQDYG